MFLQRIKTIFTAYKLSLISTYKILADYIKIIIRNRIKTYKTHEQFLGFKIHFPSRHSFFSQFVELFVERTYDFQESKNTRFIIDCGSNIGMSVLYFKWRCPQARIICFEPNPVSFMFLNKNIKDNNLKNVELFQYAIGGKDGDVNFSVGDIENSASPGASIYRTKNSNTTIISVPIRRLSPFIRERVDLLKLDIEGAEGETLNELINSNAIKNVQEVWIEYHFDASPEEYPAKKVRDMLEKTGFFLFRTTSMHSKIELIHGIRK